MKKILTLLFILSFSLSGYTQSEGLNEKVEAGFKGEKFTTLRDSVLKVVNDFFDELLDVEVGIAAIQTRHISNVGYGLDNVLFSNSELKDTFQVLRNIVESEFFIKSALQYDHFWTRLINRRDYSPNENELSNNFEEQYAAGIYFDVVFSPAWDTLVMDVDSARKMDAIAWKCKIDVKGMGAFTAEFSAAELDSLISPYVENESYTKIKRDAAPLVNEGIVASMGWLAEKFGFQPYKDPTNIKRVDFYAPTKQEFGYDSYSNPILSGNYDNIAIKGKQYYVPWKSAVITKSDKVLARIELKEEGKPSGDTLKFVSTSGLPVVATRLSDTLYEVQVDGISSKGEFGILATYNYPDSTGKEITVTAGQANISAYAMQEMNLVIVPVNQSAGVLAKVIEDSINAIYSQAATNWSVSLEEQLVIGEVNTASLDDGDAGLLSNYTDDMEAIIKAYSEKKAGNIDKNTCYLFLVEGAKSGSGKEGYMPLKNQYGFIFMGNCKKVEHTIAHELGHGPFRLYHTFSEHNEYMQAEGSTKNLMDYTKTKEKNLYKYQWDLIHDPEAMIGLFQDEEEGESHDVDIDELIAWIKEKKNSVRALDQSDFYNFNVWGNKALEADVGGHKIWVYSEVFDNGVVDLYEYYIDFVIDEGYHSGFYLSYKYNRKDEDAIRIWTYSYTDFKLLIEALGYEFPKEFKTKMIEKYMAYLKEYGSDCNKIDVIFETIPDFVLDVITIEERVDYLAVLTECSISNSGWIWGQNLDTDERKSIYNLLNISEDKQGDLFNAISQKKTSSGKSIFENLIDKLSHDEFTLIAGDILRWYNNDFDIESLDAENVHAIYWYDADHLIWGERSYSFNSNQNLDFGIITRWYTEKGNSIGSVESYKDIDPLDPILVRIERLDNVSNHSKRVIEGFQEGDEFIMPAIVFAWMIDHHDKLEQQELIDDGILIASIFVNVKSLGAANTRLARFFAIGAVVTDVGDVFWGSENTRDKIKEKWAYSKELFIAWDNITNYFARGSFSYSTIKGSPGLFTSFKMAWTEVVSNNIDVEITLGSDNFKTINEFCEINFEEE